LCKTLSTQELILVSDGNTTSWRKSLPSIRSCRPSQLGNTMRETRDLAACGTLGDHALLGGAHDLGLGNFQRRERSVAIARRNRLFDLAHRTAQARAARLIDLGSARDLARRFAGR